MDLRGNLIVAAPNLLDPNFRRAVVLMVDHDKEEGSFGLVLNRPGHLNVGAYCAELGIRWSGDDSGLVHVGGPVQPSMGWVLHDLQDLDEEPGSRVVRPGLFISNSREVLERVAQAEQVHRRIFAGYAGWGPGQLAGEMRAGAWLVCDAAEPELIFTGRGERAWDQALGAMGLDPRMIVPGATDVS